MRHGKKINHLGRTASHRKAMLRNMATSLLTSDNKRIITTVAKAKALRKFVEPLITKARTNTTHSRRVVFSHIGHKEAVKALFGEVADKVGDRPGGYTRILKIGPRKGDNAEMALIELVDFNEFTVEAPKKKTSRRRKKKSSTPKAAAAKVEEAAKEVKEKAEAASEAVEAKAEEAAEAAEEKVEEAAEESSEEETKGE